MPLWGGGGRVGRAGANGVLHGPVMSGRGEAHVVGEEGLMSGRGEAHLRERGS